MPEQDSVLDLGETGRRYWIGEGCRDDGAGTRWLCESSLEDLGLFLRKLEDLIESGENSDLEKITARYEGRPVPWEDAHPWWWQGTIAPQFRQSFIVTLGTASEFYLRFLCDHVQFLMGLTESLEKTRARNPREGLVECARKYLVEDDPSFSSPEPDTWEKVKALYRVRNQFAHSGSLVPEDDGGRTQRRLETQLRTLELPGASLESAYLNVNREFCEAAHELIASFFKDLYDELRTLCERLRAGQE